jgi:bacteriorhodopsin
MVVLLYLLFGSLTDKAEQLGGKATSTFKTLRNLIVFIWAIYPVWWIAGTETGESQPVSHGASESA